MVNEVCVMSHKKKHRTFDTREKKIDYATEGRDEEFDSFRSVMVALTSGAVGLLFTLLTTSSASHAIHFHCTSYCCALVAFVMALCLLLSSYWFGWLYFDAYRDEVKKGRTRRIIVREELYAFFDNWSVYVATILFVIGIVSVGIFVYRLITAVQTSGI